MFKLIDERYELNGDALKKARVQRGLDLGQFAYVCGWSRQYQWALENEVSDTVSSSCKATIERALINHPI